MIQLGLTLSDKEGNLPTCASDKYCTWQFNFRECGDLNSDILAHDAVELVPQPGIDFAKNNQIGIDLKSFGPLLMSSGIVLNERVSWVTFEGRDDFGYLLKLLTGQNLPETQSEFFDHMLKVYFPSFYDIKHVVKFCNGLDGDLNELAELLYVERVGISHQAGFDSLFTLRTFIKLKEGFFTEYIEEYSRVLYGLSI